MSGRISSAVRPLPISGSSESLNSVIFFSSDRCDHHGPAAPRQPGKGSRPWLQAMPEDATQEDRLSESDDWPTGDASDAHFSPLAARVRRAGAAQRGRTGWLSAVRWCFSLHVPIPLYAPPAFRSSRKANPFDQTPAQRLKVLMDEPLRSGMADGEGEFVFIGNDTAGYPEAAVVLRSYLGHPAFQVLYPSEELDDEGAVVVGEPRSLPGRHILPLQVKTERGLLHTGLRNYEGALQETAQMATKHQLDEADARDGVLLYRIGSELDADLIVTDRGWLLSERGRRHGEHLANIVSPAEALALMGLYLRWHNQAIIIGGAAIRWHQTSMRRSAAFTAMPSFERWNQAGRAWCDTNGNLTLESLNQTLLTRVARGLGFRDNIFSLSATLTAAEPEEMLCELDSLLFSLVGAFDVAARIVDHILGWNSRKVGGWQDQGWQSRLEGPASALHDYTKAGSEMQRTFEVLRLLRNSVHNEALDLIRDNGVYLVTLSDDLQDKLRRFLRSGYPGWTADILGIRVLPPGGATAAKWLAGTGRYSVTVRRAGAPKPTDPLMGQLTLDVRQFINKLFPAALTALNDIMRLTSLGTVPGYTPKLEAPSRVNLTWEYSDTTGHRLRLLYGLTEMA